MAEPMTSISRSGCSDPFPRIRGQLYTSTPLALSQTDEWPVAPDEGYPTLTRPLPPKRWHFTAQTERTDQMRIACLFSAQGPGEEAPDLCLSVQDSQVVLRVGQSVAGQIDLAPDSGSALQASCGKEQIRIEG